MIGACRCAALYFDFGVMFGFGLAKMFSATIFETYCYHKYIWIVATDYFTYFYLIVPSPLKAIQLHKVRFTD